MRNVLIGLAAPLAALVVTAAPAAAQSPVDQRPVVGIGIPNAKVGVPAATFPGPGQFVAVPGGFVRDFKRHDGRRHRDGDRRRRHRDFDDGVFVGGWAYGPDLVNNRSWEADSFNGWWHDRPDRAYPRWVRSNRDCAPERMWWGGGVWRCSW